MISPLTKDLFLAACKRHCVLPNRPESDEDDQIPQNPVDQFFWLCTRLNQPLFSQDGAHVGWREAEFSEKKFLIGFFAGIQTALKMNKLPHLDGWEEMLG